MKMNNYKTEIFTRVIGVGEFGGKYGEEIVEYILGSYIQSVNVPHLDYSWLEYSYADNSSSDEEIGDMLSSKDLLFIVSGSSYIETATKIADIAKTKGILTVAVVINESVEKTDATERILSVANCVISVSEDAKSIKDEILNVILTILHPIYINGFVSIDWYDVEAVISKAGKTYLASGSGETADEIVENILASLSPSFKIKDAKFILVNAAITNAQGLYFLDSILEKLSKVLHDDCIILFDCVLDSKPNVNVLVG